MLKLTTLILFGMLTATGCETLSSGDSREYESIDENGETIHIVSYNPHGLNVVVDQRRKSAELRMRNRCGSDNYKILKEEISPSGRDEGRTVDSIGVDTLMYIEYQCKED